MRLAARGRLLEPEIALTAFDEGFDEDEVEVEVEKEDSSMGAGPAGTGGTSGVRARKRNVRRTEGNIVVLSAGLIY